MTRLLTLTLFSTAIGFAAIDCAALARQTLPETRISDAALIDSGEFKNQRKLPPFCRVALSLHPSSDSDIRVEVWLPAGNWNQKFLGVGNGGYAGSISYGGLAEAIRNGYATASTDTGHSDVGTGAVWALNHPEKVIDYGHRAIHLMTVRAKSLATVFYGTAPVKSYFNSCSNGGRQALMEAQRYPADYDGIIAGAPANDWVHLMTNAMRLMRETLVDPAAYIPAAKLPAIQSAALAACDRADAVADRVVENPAACRFEPEVLACKGADSNDCLTPPQLASLKAIP